MFRLPAALGNLSRVCRPDGRLVTVLQHPSPHVHVLSLSPHTSVQALVPLMRLIFPGELAGCAAASGFDLESEQALVLKSGKEFTVQVYRHAVG